MDFKVALVGRPNVGKSTLFNRLLGYQHSIVEKTPGVTRDRIEGLCTWCGKNFILVDTGGIADSLAHSVQEKVLEQVDEAIRSSDLILFVVDAKGGLLDVDKEVAARLRKKGGGKSKILLVANKIDSPGDEALVSEWYSLGFGSPFSVSALHGRAIGDLLDEVVRRLDFSGSGGQQASTSIKLCVAGRPNVGKSSIVNALLGEPRVIVHEEPGTTRDVVDTLFTYEGNPFVFADTAGLRKRSKVTESVEFYSRTRTIKAIRRSEVVLLVLEAPRGVMDQDKRIAGEIEEAGKGIVIVANKWDQLKPEEKSLFKDFVRHVRSRLSFVSYAPVLPTSALTGSGIDKILPSVIKVLHCWQQRLDAGELKKTLNDLLAISPPPSVKRERVRLRSLVPVGSSPPVVLLKVTGPAEIPASYLRFIEARLRERFDLEGTPIRIKVFSVEKKGKK